MKDSYWRRLETKLPAAYNDMERALVRRAYEVATQAHAGQTRASGEPYISHCVAVAEILLEMNMPATVVAAGLLHDTLEDTDLTYEDLKETFGEEVANLVEGVTKLTALPRVSRADLAQRGENGREAPSTEEEKPPSPKASSWRRQDLIYENLRKTFLAMWEDIRVVPIKLADRLHNMRTLHYLPEHKRRRIAQETLDIFAPLAHRLGMERIRHELEDLAFRYVNPRMYRVIAQKLAERRSERERAVQQIVERLKQVLRNEGIEAEVRGRPKHIYSIYQKMQRKGVSFEEVHDVRGVRIIIPMQKRALEDVLQEKIQDQGRPLAEEERYRLLLQARKVAEGLERRKSLQEITEDMRKRGQPPHKLAQQAAVEWFRHLQAERRRAISLCYTVLGIVHTHWTPIPGEFDDYIARPKPNGYQSLHTAVIFDDGKPLEVQIRTQEMHEMAEYGVAAHWAYKENVEAPEELSRKIRWFRSLLEWRQDVFDAVDFMDGVKSDVFEDRVYVFTPKGDIIDLPRGATPIDFAYYIHTEIGHRCRGAKVNGRWVPLNYELKTGDIVEIITGKRGGPSRDWLNPELGLVKTQRARAKIRRWFRQQDREQNLAQGRTMLEKELERLGLGPVDMENLLQRFGFTREEDLYVAIGCGDLSIQRIINYLNETYRRSLEEDTIRVRRPSAPKEPSEITVMGASGLYTRFARCCNPVLGDDIVGYITQGRGVSVHRKDCPNFLALQMRHPERVIDVHWGQPRETFPVPIYIRAFDRRGLMRDISDVIAREGINIQRVYVETDDIMAEVHLVVEVRDLSQLHRLLVRIENLPNVVSAVRERQAFPAAEDGKTPSPAAQ